MTRGWWLLRIETRRSLGMWVLPAMVLLAWYGGRERSPDGVALWPDTSAAIGRASVLLGPIIGAAAAWAAYRDRRRRMDELVATMPFSGIGRDLTVWAATLAWACLAYVLGGAYHFVMTVRDATWGEPSLSLMVAGIVALASYAALGFFAGTLLPSVFTAPLVAIALYLVPGMAFSLNYGSSIRHLSPWSAFDPSRYGVLHGVWPNDAVPLSLWLLGLAGASLAGGALLRRRSVAAGAVLVGSLVIGVASASALVRPMPGPEAARAALIPYEPTCTTNVVPVCVHPAYSAVLDRTATVVGGVLEPIVGLPGVADRAEQYAYIYGPPPEGTLIINPYNEFNGVDHLAQAVAGATISGGEPLAGGLPPSPTAAQCAVERWLVRRIGLEPNSRGVSCMPSTGYETFLEYEQLNVEIDEAAARFGDVAPSQRRAWLEQNFFRLRAGELTLPDLP